MGSGLILGIESSCDETAAAVVRCGVVILSNVVASQIATHSPYGGVVPELASREHLRNIVPVVRAALREAGTGFTDLDAIAVTGGPGLAGALLVGISYAKMLAFSLKKPLIAVNHLEGHIHAVLLEQAQHVAHSEREREGVGLPALALVVSGGHTHLYLARRQRRRVGLIATLAARWTTLPERPSIKSPNYWVSAIRVGRGSTLWLRMGIRMQCHFPLRRSNPRHIGKKRRTR